MARELEALLANESLPVLIRWEDFDVLERSRGSPEPVRRIVRRSSEGASRRRSASWRKS
jgi:hypothetical protein